MTRNSHASGSIWRYGMVTGRRVRWMPHWRVLREALARVNLGGWKGKSSVSLLLGFKGTVDGRWMRLMPKRGLDKTTGG